MYFIVTDWLLGRPLVEMLVGKMIEERRTEGRLGPGQPRSRPREPLDHDVHSRGLGLSGGDH